MTDEIELLRRYAEDRDEAAFAALVAQSISLVYSAALRQLDGAVHRAEDVTQTVFIQLARHARTVAKRDDLVGWLYTATHHAAANLKRTESRRQRREEEATTMQDSAYEPAADPSWEQLRPVLDAALLELSEGDRRSLLLRFFQEQRFAALGRQLGVTEDAARMRVERSLEKLRLLLARRGITSTSAALAAAFAGHATVAAPAALTAAVTCAALAGAAGGAAAAATGIFMSTKSALAAVVIVAALGLATVKFDVVSRLTGGVAATPAASETPGPRLSAQPPPPEVAKPRPISPATAPITPQAEPATATVAVLPGRERVQSDLPAGKELPPQIVLGEVLGPNNSYRDDLFGISATYPEGWAVRHAARWGDGNRQNTVSLDAGLPIVPSMYYKRYQPAELARRESSVEAYFREEAAKKEASRLPAAPDYRNVPESFEFVEINGAPAMSYFATFTQGDKVMTEYFIRVAGQQSYVMFFTTGELEAVRPAMPKIQQMAKSVRIP